MKDLLRWLELAPRVVEALLVTPLPYPKGQPYSILYMENESKQSSRKYVLVCVILTGKVVSFKDKYFNIPLG